MTVRVGIVGAGLIARFHIGMLAGSSADHTIAAVYDPDQDRAADLARTSGAAACDSVAAVCERADAVIVCTWTAAHRPVVDEVVSRGLPVLCEKPLAPDLESARALVRTVEAAGVVNQVGLVLRGSPAFHLARQLAHDPDAGRVMAISFRDDQYLPVQGLYASDWRADPSRAGRGVLLEHSIHDVDLLEWLAGPIISVSAREAAFHGLAPIEDTVVASIAFASGALATLATAWHDVLERPSQRRVEILCERRVIAVEGDWFGPVRWTDAGGERSAADADLLDALADPLPDGGNPDADFVRAVAENRPASPDVADALRAHEVVDALYRSAAADGAPVAPATSPRPASGPADPAR